MNKETIAELEIDEPPYDCEAFAAQVAQLWPHLFGKGVYLPLQIGIHKKLRADAEERGVTISANMLKEYLTRHCSHIQYLKALSEGGMRFGVKGEATKLILEVQIKSAKEKLDVEARQAT